MDLNYKQINDLSQSNYKKLLKNYKFNQEDAELLQNLKNTANIYTKELLIGFYEFILEFDHAKMFLHNSEILQRHEKGIENWYLNLFFVIYDEEYFEKLYLISEIHVRIGLPAHYVNAAFSYIRSFLKDLLIKEKLVTSGDKVVIVSNASKDEKTILTIKI